MTAATRRNLLLGALSSTAAPTLPARARAADEAILDDASRLNATRVARHVVVRQADERRLIDMLRLELKDAAAAGRPVAMGAARHSMGGQSIASGGTVFTFASPACEPDRAQRIYRAGSGTRWRDVVATLDAIGFSPKVLQANHDFGVAATFSVNAHGWPVPFGPAGSTVRALRLMLADGSIVTCSRAENQELFHHAMGGYGLFGIIVDLDVEMVPNVMLKSTFEELPAARFGTRFPAACAEPDVAMAYGRLNVARGRFLQDALLVAYRPVATTGALPRADAGGGIADSVSREVYRAEVGSDWGKRTRWLFETTAGPHLGSATRNTLLNSPASILEERNPRRTDVLHEYFVPAARFPEFLAVCRDVIPKAGQDLLNVTLRFVAADRESVLAYAPTDRIAAVMSFSQARTAQAGAPMQTMTRELIDRVLEIGGSFYLPYRLHARPDQLSRAYPAADAFAACKRRHDPGLLFRNSLWDTYFA